MERKPENPQGPLKYLRERMRGASEAKQIAQFKQFAREQFLLLHAAGKDGQSPVRTYEGNGVNEIVFTEDEFPNGTVIKVTETEIFNGTSDTLVSYFAVYHDPGKPKGSKKIYFFEAKGYVGILSQWDHDRSYFSISNEGLQFNIVPYEIGSESMLVEDVTSKLIPNDVNMYAEYTVDKIEVILMGARSKQTGKQKAHVSSAPVSSPIPVSK